MLPTITQTQGSEINWFSKKEEKEVKIVGNKRIKIPVKSPPSQAKPSVAVAAGVIVNSQVSKKSSNPKNEDQEKRVS